MESTVPEYGIHVDRVSLQEIRLPEGVLNAAAKACETAYQPLVAERQAAADTMRYAAEAEKQRMLLGGEAKVIGNDAVAKKEVLGSIQPFSMGGRGFLDVLGAVFDGMPGGVAKAGRARLDKTE
jgi:regulator of protease activity HflC (stomatin/prohibitin superfamily)